MISSDLNLTLTLYPLCSPPSPLLLSAPSPPHFTLLHFGLRPPAVLPSHSRFLSLSLLLAAPRRPAFPRRICCFLPPALLPSPSCSHLFTLVLATCVDPGGLALSTTRIKPDSLVSLVLFRILFFMSAGILQHDADLPLMTLSLHTSQEIGPVTGSGATLLCTHAMMS